MSEHVFEREVECEKCKGTGLYAGIGERDGFAVVCHDCGGEGKRTLRVPYKDFERRWDRPGVRRVLQVNPGICVGGDDPEQFGGMPHKDWQTGKPFPDGSEMRHYVCPRWWAQAAGIKADFDCPGFPGMTFSQCPQFGDKAVCWERWDREAVAEKGESDE